MSIKTQIGALIDAIISGDGRVADVLAPTIVQARASEQVGGLVQKPEPVRESVLTENDVIGSLSQILSRKYGTTPDQAARDIEALIQHGDVPQYLADAYMRSEFVEQEDGESVLTFHPTSGFMTFLNSLCHGAGDEIIKLMDDDAGYDEQGYQPDRDPGREDFHSDG